MKAGVFREEYIAIFARELLRGLEYLHGEGKLHRDIKGELAERTKLKLSRKYSPHGKWRCQAGGLWCFWSIDSHDDEEGGLAAVRRN